MHLTNINFAIGNCKMTLTKLRRIWRADKTK